MSLGRFPSQLRYRLGATAVVLAAVAALVALASRALAQPFLLADFPPMKAEVAVATLAACVAWFAFRSGSRLLRGSGVALAGVVAAIALFTLLDPILRLDAAIGDRSQTPPIATAVALFCLAGVLALTGSVRAAAVDARQVLRLVGLATALFTLLLYMAEPSTIRVVRGFETFSVDSAAAFSLLFLASGADRAATSLRWQIAHLGMVAIAPLAALTVHFAGSEREIALRGAEERLESAARLGAERLDAVVEDARRLLLFLARSPDVLRAGPSCLDRLASFSTLNTSLSALYVVNRRGIVTCSNVRGVAGLNIADRDYVRDALSSQAFTVSGLFVSRLKNMPRIAVVTPLLVEAREPVLLAAVLDLASFGDPLRNLAAEFDPRATLTLVDRRGMIIARHPQGHAAGASAVDEPFVARALSDPGSTFEAVEIDARSTVFASRRVLADQGALIVGLPKRNVVAPVDKRMNQRLALIGLVLVASVGLGTLGGEALALRPLRRLTAYARKLQDGDLGARPQVSARGEVGALSRALGVMAAAVEDRERRLAGAEALFRGLFDHSPDCKAVLRVDPDGAFRVETWNAAAHRATGLTPDDVVGRTPTEVFPGPRGDLIERDLARTLELGQVSRIEREPTVNGVPQTYEMVQVPLRGADGRIERIFISAHDISDRKRVDRLKNEFVSTVSHELRTPLTSIAGSLGLLAGGVAGPLGDKASHLIAIAHSNSLRLVRLINDILDIEKIEAGRMAFDLMEIDLIEIVEQAVRGLRAYADEFEVVIDVAHDETDLVVRGDADRLNQVVTNLVSNAIKFSPRGGTVEVAVSAEEDVATIAVRDRGAGIPEAFRPRLFSKFAQADGSDSRRKGGTGLGLAIVKEIVERHAGAVSYGTELGVGTEFRVRLPRFRRRDVAPPMFASGEALPRVMICEDDVFIAALLSELLRDAGFDSLAVGTVRAALKAAETEQIDAILVDLNLPDGDGISLIRDLQAAPRTRDIPIVVVSAQAGRGRADARASALDVVAWLEKPVDARRLAAVLRARLGVREPRPRVLHVEDDADLRKVVAAAIGSIADVVSVGSFDDAERELARGAFQLAIVDMTLDDGSGLDLLATLETRRPHAIPTIIFSADDIDRDVAARVEAALTKSRTSLSVLVETVRRLVAERRRVVTL
ncbi:ATP-binding protein [Methylopila henanensis]|uniref:histidine kinase n=1 Tax=Methylopila henanensis TaxID=873516 RepID=A0ABW4K5K4_9HYPH